MQQTIDYLELLGAQRHEQVLENGLRIVLYERPHAPISLLAAFKSGGRYDPIDKPGLAHIVEHMLVAGTESFPTEDKLTQHIVTSLGPYNAHTSSDILWVDLNFADTEDTPKAAAILDEILHRPVLSEATLATELGAVQRELGNWLTNPSTSLWYLYHDLFFDNKVGRPVLGNEESIRSTTIKDVRNFYDSQLISENLTLVAAGDITPKTLAAAFSSLNFRTTKAARANISSAAPRDKTILIKPFDTNGQIDFLIGFRTCALGDPDAPILSVIASLIGGGQASILTKELRYKKGYIYHGGAGSHQYSSEGTWYYKTACAKKDLQPVLDIICKEFARVRAGKITQKELDTTKTKFIKSLKMSMQTSQEWADYHLRFELFKTGQTVSDRMNAIQAVTLEDIARVGKKYFVPGSARIALAGNVTEGEFTLNF